MVQTAVTVDTSDMVQMPRGVGEFLGMRWGGSKRGSLVVC